MTRTGILLCTCDEKISKEMDVGAVAEALRPDGVVITAPHICLPDGMSDLRRTILAQNLDRMVVAACPARFQERRLWDVCLEAGINPNCFTLVDWREGCAWAHRGDREGATRQAVDLVRMGLVRVIRARQLDGVRTAIAPRALVIGGGIAGMTAALALADRGVPVTLVERQAKLGGQFDGYSPGDVGDARNGAGADRTKEAVLAHPRILTLLNAGVAAVEGTVGSYRVRIAGGSETLEMEVGAVVIATGAQEYRDPGLYRHDGRRVVTLSEFERQTRDSPIPPNQSLVYILCAGSRDQHVPYCSRTCCLDALDQAIRVKRANPTAEITVLFRDFYLLGDELNEERVREARRLVIRFVRYGASTPPRVGDDFVAVADTAGRLHEIGYDRVVLATPYVPQDDAGMVARLFHLTRDEDGFFLDSHFRIRPEDQPERGIFVCGSAHRPADAETAILQGMTAAARAFRFIHKREMLHPSSGAHVNRQVCTGCAQCVETCAFGAIEMRQHSVLADVRDGEAQMLDHAAIDPFLCQACGNCVVACPAKAIDLPTSSDAQIFAQIEAALAKREDKEAGAVSVPVPLVFACHWSGFSAMELAGARRVPSPATVRVIELPCSARLDPMHVLYAFLNGADSVMLALCPPDECHFASGNRYAEARVENLRAQLEAHGVDPRRLIVARLLGDDANAWVQAVEAAGHRFQSADRAIRPPVLERGPIANRPGK
ncbi:MAG: FAD-dependent oxidoreductase [Anaerolineae bacterium]